MHGLVGGRGWGGAYRGVIIRGDVFQTTVDRRKSQARS